MRQPYLTNGKSFYFFIIESIQNAILRQLKTGGPTWIRNKSAFKLYKRHLIWGKTTTANFTCARKYTHTHLASAVNFHQSCKNSYMRNNWKQIPRRYTLWLKFQTNICYKCAHYLSKNDGGAVQWREIKCLSSELMINN